MRMVARTSALRPKAFGRRAANEVRRPCLVRRPGVMRKQFQH